MARRPELQSMAKRVRGRGSAGAWVFAKGVQRVPWPCLYRPEREGGAAPQWTWPSMACGLDCNQEGEGIKRGNCRLMGESEERLGCNLMEGFEGWGEARETHR
jgi:hypothetical protein